MMIEHDVPNLKDRIGIVESIRQVIGLKRYGHPATGYLTRTDLLQILICIRTQLDTIKMLRTQNAALAEELGKLKQR